MARKSKEPPVDVREFPEFYSRHMRGPFMQMMTAYLFAEPPPYTHTAGSTEPDLRVWTSNTDEMRDTRGDWMNSLVMDASDAALIQDLRRVMDRYRAASGTVPPRFRTGTECGVWLPFTRQQAEQFAPHLQLPPEDLGPPLIYVQDSLCNSLLPAPAHEQIANENKLSCLSHIALRQPGKATAVSQHARDRFAERIESTTEWALRFCSRLEEFFCAGMFMHILSDKAGLTTHAVLEWFPWIEDLARLTGCWPQINESRNPRRGSLSLDAMISHATMRSVDVSRLRSHMTLVGFHMEPLMAKAAAVHAGWRESYPNAPMLRMIASRTDWAPKIAWLEEWRHSMGSAVTRFDIANTHIISIPRGS